MKIGGIQKLSLVDYPGKTSAAIFTIGCNMRCGYCHNPELVLPERYADAIPENDIIDFLKMRIGKLEGVVISGGEPTMHKDLPSFFAKVKELGFHTKLDSNGTHPQMIKELISNNLVDYIAMDIKSDLETYDLVAGLDQLHYSEEHISFILSAITKSVNLIKNSNIPYEFRTTVVRELHKESTFQNIAHWLNGSKKYYLQNYTDNEQVISPGFTAYTKEELLEFVKILSPYIREVSLRGIL